MFRKVLLMVLAFSLLLAGSALAAQPIAISDMNVDFGKMTEGPVARKNRDPHQRQQGGCHDSERDHVLKLHHHCSWTEQHRTRQVCRNGHQLQHFQIPRKVRQDRYSLHWGGEGKFADDSYHCDVNPIPMGVMEVAPRKTSVTGLVSGKSTSARIMIKNAGDAPMVVTAIKSRKFKTTYWQGDLKIEAGQDRACRIQGHSEKGWSIHGYHHGLFRCP